MQMHHGHSKHIYILVSLPRPPLATHIILCSLQLSYKWAHYSQQAREVYPGSFICSHTSELSHCILTLFTFSCCACVCVCAFMCRAASAWRKCLLDQPQPQWWMKLPSSFGFQHDKESHPGNLGSLDSSPKTLRMVLDIKRSYLATCLPQHTYICYKGLLFFFSNFSAT